MKFNTQFSHPSPVHDNRGENSLCRQEFQVECDLKNIIKKYEVTGFLVDPSVKATRQPMFGDFTDVPEAQEAWNRVAAARSAFESFPDRIKKRFNYDFGEMLSFLNDENNRAEAISLGLIADKKDETAAASIEQPSKGASAPVASPPVSTT